MQTDAAPDTGPAERVTARYRFQLDRNEHTIAMEWDRHRDRWKRASIAVARALIACRLADDVSDVPDAEALRMRAHMDAVTAWHDAAVAAGHLEACIESGEAERQCHVGPDGRPLCVAKRDADPQDVATTAAWLRTEIEPVHGTAALRNRGGDLIARNANGSHRGSDPDEAVAALALAVVAGPHPTPTRGMRFVHARYRAAVPGVRCADSPRVTMRVTKVTRYAVHYVDEAQPGTASTWCDRPLFAGYVGAYLPNGA